MSVWELFCSLFFRERSNPSTATERQSFPIEGDSSKTHVIQEASITSSSSDRIIRGAASNAATLHPGSAAGWGGPRC